MALSRSLRNTKDEREGWAVTLLQPCRSGTERAEGSFWVTGGENDHTGSASVGVGGRNSVQPQCDNSGFFFSSGVKCNPRESLCELVLPRSM